MGGRSQKRRFAAQPASEFMTPIQALQKRLAVGERPYGMQQYLENNFFKNLRVDKTKHLSFLLIGSLKQ